MALTLPASGHSRVYLHRQDWTVLIVRAALVRSRKSQPAAILDDAGALLQGDGRVRPALTRGTIG